LIITEYGRTGALWSLLDVAIEPTIAADAARLHCALGEMAAADATFSFHTDAETGQTIIHGSTEEQLYARIEILRSAYMVEVDIGRPQVAYLETIVRAAETKYTHRRQSGGSGQYAEATIGFEPLDRRAGIIFENKSAAGAVPSEYVSAVEKGVRRQAETGVLAGFPTIDFKFTLIDAKYHDVDSSPPAFEIAARACFRELRRTGSVKILEPIMRVEIMVPSNYVDKVVSDLWKRGGDGVTIEPRGVNRVLTSLIPMKVMFGYADALNGLSDGRAEFSMHYESHQEVPAWPEPPDDRFPPAMAMQA
jgi:elongation factor G